MSMSTSHEKHDEMEGRDGCVGVERRVDVVRGVGVFPGVGVTGADGAASRDGAKDGVGVPAGDDAELSNGVAFCDGAGVDGVISDDAATAFDEEISTAG